MTKEMVTLRKELDTLQAAAALFGTAALSLTPDQLRSLGNLSAQIRIHP
jgi:hypothetical protein